MAEIISISLTQENLEDIQFLEKQLHFTGRSEVIRAGLRSLLEEQKTLSSLKGTIEGTIIVTHKEKYTDEFSELKHSAHHLVQTHIHQDLKEHMCMEILLFKGNAPKIIDFYKKLISAQKLEKVKIIVV